jgi:hypothetical protein
MVSRPKHVGLDLSDMGLATMPNPRCVGNYARPEMLGSCNHARPKRHGSDSRVRPKVLGYDKHA